MKFEQMLHDFEGYHQKFLNRLYHYAGISIITISVFGLLPMSYLLLAAAFLLDLIICPMFALPVLLIGGIFLLIAHCFPWQAHILFFILGWAFQLIGHYLAERNRPAFLQNLLHFYVGPRWMVQQWLSPLGFNLAKVSHLKVNTDLLDLLRLSLCRLIPLLGNQARKKVIKRIGGELVEQQKLRSRYQIEGQEPAGYDESLRKRIIQLKQSQPGSVLIETSGSTSRPKQILYNRERVKIFKETSLLAGLQVFKALKVSTPSLFVFSGLKQDKSFASLVVSHQEGIPSLMTGLTDPAKFLFHPCLKKVIDHYGANAARLLVLIINDPALLYATNPSTLAVFFQSLSQDWNHYRKMLNDFVDEKEIFSDIRSNKEWFKLLARMGHGDYGDRILSLMEKEILPDYSMINPSLRGYVSWDGGYVTSFLQQIHRFLPPERYRHVPMFSMSTETMQTMTLMDEKENFHFLPISEGVLYEFLEEGNNSTLLPPQDLVAGKSYVMVVSDRWGLLRYNTKDIFLCKSKWNGWPNLAFQKRDGLTYSFTGEKITGEQIMEVLDRLLDSSNNPVQYTLIPSRPSTGVPYYVLLEAYAVKALACEQFAREFDKELSEVNREYRDKRESGRLGPIKFVSAHYDDVVKYLDPRLDNPEDKKLRSWESQFKLTPLTLKLWQDLGLEKH